MTIEEYNKAMDAYSIRIRNGEEIMDEVNDFQYEFMRNVLKNYVADSPEKEIIRNILDYAVNDSTSGSSVQYVEDKDLADKVMEIIFDEIGEYMLDFPEYYEENGYWVIDCVFAGYYVPDWDGWYD